VPSISATQHDRPRAFPALLPIGRAARVVLLALVAFAFVKGAIWGTTTPSIWGPDEDYHFLYADGIADEARIIDPDRPLYSDEYAITAARTKFDEYGQGPRQSFFGHPKFVLRGLDALPPEARVQRTEGRGIGVVHPPLYHLVAAGAAKTVDSAWRARPSAPSPSTRAGSWPRSCSASPRASWLPSSSPCSRCSATTAAS
jgi:hypothetical protein